MLDGLLRWLKGPIPDVFVDFTCDRGRLFAELVNLGDAPAHDVAVTFRPPISDVAGRALGELGLFRNTTFLPPGKRIATFVDTTAGFLGREEQTLVEIEVTFRDARGRTCVNTFRHELGVYRDFGWVDARPELPS